MLKTLSAIAAFKIDYSVLCSVCFHSKNQDSCFFKYAILSL